MKKVFLWGAGFYSSYVYQKIDQQRCKICGIVDGDEEKQGKEWMDGLSVGNPEVLMSCAFDCVVITPQKYEGILNAYLKMGLPKDKALVYWEDQGLGGLFLNRSQYIDGLERKCQVLEWRLENAPYEYGVERTPFIKSGVELLERILYTKCSLSRFGDGEFELMLGRNRSWFQEVNQQFTERLREIMRQEDAENLIIAIPDDFGCLKNYKESTADNIRSWLSNGVRQEVMQLIDQERSYYDAYVSRPYILYKDDDTAKQIFPLFKKIWADRDLIIVEGKYARMGIGNDLFSTAASIKRIICPPKNAWNQLDLIKTRIEQIAKPDDLICVSLGAYATIIAYDLSSKFQVLDIGQLDNEYDWYIRGAKDRIAIPGKMAAEVGFDFGSIDSMEYNEQIVCKID